MYSKNELKRMFLKVLYEIQYGSLTGCSNSVASIISSWFKRYWDVELSEAERKLLGEAVKEMEGDDLIEHDESQRLRGFVVLTEAGKEIVEMQMDPNSRVKRYY